jgi:uncharacterized protein YpiB (UPF0302 family)
LAKVFSGPQNIFPQKILHKIIQNFTAQIYINITFKETEIPKFTGEIKVVITLPNLEGRKEKLLCSE